MWGDSALVIALALIGWCLLSGLVVGAWMALASAARASQRWSCQVCGRRSSEALAPLCDRCAAVLDGA